jgi:hypothetical protein
MNFFGGNICFDFFGNHSHFMFFLYSLATYHLEGLDRSYNFVVEIILIKAHMEKL